MSNFERKKRKPSNILYQEPESIKVLLIEDNPGDARLVKEMLVDAWATKFSLTHVRLIREGLSLLRDEGYHLILLDLSLPDGHGLDTVRQVCAVAPHLPVVILTGLDDETIAIRAVQEGAQDYLVKGQMDSNLLARAIRYAIERKRAEEKLRESEERFRELAENIREVFYIYEQDMHQISYISPAYMEIWGRTCESLYQEPKSIWDNVHPEDKDRVMRSLEKKSRGEVEEVYRIVRPDGSIRWIKDRSFPIYDNSGKMHRIVGIAADITDLKFGEEKLKYLSLHDPLTGLYNRIYFEEEMTRIEKSRSDTVGIISCDVDGLKLVNDTLGHNQGDNLLVAAAGVIQGSFREGDLIARIGGDEFSVVLPNTTDPAVENACQRIQEAVVSYNATNPELPLSISIGFAVSHGVHRNLKDLFKEADNNMYRKKLYHTQSVRSTIVKTLINTLKARDFATEKHLIRLEKLLVNLAVFIGLPESTTSDLALLARFHDIGKVGISDSILFKKGPLTSEEWTEMKRHCEIGYRIAIAASDLIPIADWVLKHHEWWNGQGYPLGIKGEEIPIECRLLAIAEAYEALTSVRPYRSEFPHAKAVAELLSYSGTQFDPKLLEKFVEMLETHPPELESNETSAV
jgi:diguanylate cyclase (GGDEF)-like protein/PAS domain S-box-containing protein